MGYDPNQPRDEIGRWAEVAGANARKAAGLKYLELNLEQSILA